MDYGGWPRFQDPTTYPDLEAYLDHTLSPQSAYNSIRKLPGIDLRQTVDIVWKRASGRTMLGLRPAGMAIEAGYP